MKWKFAWKSLVESLNRPGRAALSQQEQLKRQTAIQTRIASMKEKFQEDMPEIIEEMQHDFSKFTRRDNNRFEDSDDDMGEVA
jgi:hypothetical protein